MSVLVESTIEINNNINEMFAYITNMDNYSEWFPEVIAIKSEDSLDHGIVGKKYLETLSIPFKGENEYSIEVKESEKNVRFVTEGKVPPLLPRVTIDFTEISKTVTTIKWKMESRSKNLLFNLIFLPFIRKEIKKRAQQGMLNLKHILDMSN